MKTIEKFEIPGHTFCSIDDRQRRRVELVGFPFNREQVHERFQAWSGGCSIGDSAKIEDCRKAIYDHAVQRLTEKRAKLLAELRVIEKSLSKLQPEDVFKLGQFAVERFSHEDKA